MATQRMAKLKTYWMSSEKNHVVRENAGPYDSSKLEISSQRCRGRATVAAGEAYNPDAGLRDDTGAEDQIPGQRFAFLL